ncbi:hypothetical protein [Actinoplanes sp. NPDC051851]|uniref:hypothetical protein n=1 Tax=Actinoplanes sp. NPDC051851 TaxID=3154753 RepID=UPI003413B937
MLRIRNLLTAFREAAAGRTAAALGLAGTTGHLALAAGHAGHMPVLMAGMLVLTLVCVRCSVHLWRRPDDRRAWLDMIGLAAVMAVLHLAAGMTGGLPLAILAIPAVQLLLAGIALLRRPVPTASR